MTWGSPVEVERLNRIKISVAAHAYEVHNESFMSDGEYDELSRAIDLSVDTGCSVHDEYFNDKFHTDTGMWIYSHPNREGLEKLWQTHYKNLQVKS